MENRPKDKEFFLSGNFKSGHLNRRTDFRKYLEKTGVLNKITEILMDLYENPATSFPVLEYMRKRLTDTNPDDEKIAKLRSDLKEAKTLKDYLEKENQTLKAELNKTQYNLSDKEDAEN